MRRPDSAWEPWVAALIVLLLLFTIHDAVMAAERTVTAADDLHEAVAAAAPGDTLRLAPGVHPGNLRIDRPLTLSGAPGAVLDAGGRGDVIRVAAPDVTLRGLTIRRSGQNLTAMNAGVFVEQQAARVRIEDNTLEAITFGIWLDGSPDAVVIGNRIRGDAAVRSQDRGNGIHLFNTTGAEILDNAVRDVRDGIYIDVSNGNTLRGNELRDLRYGIHYMYSHRNEVVGNLTRNTRTGYALMQSKFLTVTGNRSERDQNYGILMNFITNSTIAGNVVTDVQRGRSPGVSDAHGIPGAEGKALFVYNSQYNTIHDNRFEAAEIGIHLTAGSEDNRIYRNAFVANREQVKYVANREQEWSFEGVGNYWSDYLGWDLDADGIGDRPHEPNDAVDKLLWRHPEAKLLLNSPAVVTLRWVQHQFPVLRPLGVRDSAPLMAPPVHGEG